MTTEKPGLPLRKRLGRGLDALMSPRVLPPAPVMPLPDPSRESVSEPAGAPLSAPDHTAAIHYLPIAAVRPNKHQPREHFDHASLESLSQSIRTAGVMQPIVVRPPDKDGIHELIAGERRLRAARMAGLNAIPSLVRSVDDQTAAEWALIENLQREDLDPIERGRAFRRLAAEFHLTHEQIAQRVGLDRSTVTNLIRLCDLDPQTEKALRSGAITLGHARALLGVGDDAVRRALLHQTISHAWPVRVLEARIRESQTRGTPPAQRPVDSPMLIDPVHLHMRDLARRLSEHLGTRVDVHPGRKKGTGRMTIDFFSLDQFEGLLSRLGYRGE